MNNKTVRGFLFFDELTRPVFWLAMSIGMFASLMMTYFLVTRPVSAWLFYHHQLVTSLLIIGLYKSFSHVLLKWSYTRSKACLSIAMEVYVYVFLMMFLSITGFLLESQEPMSVFLLFAMSAPWVTIWLFMLVMVYTYLFTPIRR